MIVMHAHACMCMCVCVCDLSYCVIKCDIGPSANAYIACTCVCPCGVFLEYYLVDNRGSANVDVYMQTEQVTSTHARVHVPDVHIQASRTHHYMHTHTYIYTYTYIHTYTCSRVFMWDTGSSVGEISGHSKKILSCDLKQARPFQIATGSEDFQVKYSTCISRAESSRLSGVCVYIYIYIYICICICTHVHTRMKL
jgi:hypothetical protein